MEKQQITIEDWDGEGGIRLPAEALQAMGVDVGDTVYLFVEFIGTTRVLVLSKHPRIHEGIDELVEQWDREHTDTQEYPVDSNG